MDDYQPRLLRLALRESQADTPVILLNGARQTGKSTFVEHGLDAGSQYLTLDDPGQLAAARADPLGFVSARQGLLVIDEAQKAPELFAAIKLSVDRDRRPGRFLLTGSADVFLLPTAAESLAGRMEVLTLHPFAQAELAGGNADWIGFLLAGGNPLELSLPATPADLPERIITGGYPEVLARKQPARRRAWFKSYVTTITQRDIRELSDIDGLAQLPRLLALIAARSGGLQNFAELSRASGIAQATLRRYLVLLQATFLYQPLPAWHANLGKRLIKAPKSYLVDTGLTAALTGVDAAGFRDSPLRGALVESFVHGELRRLLDTDPVLPRLHHYRSAGGVEVDFVLEDAAGRLLAIEVKAAATVGQRDFRGLVDLRKASGERYAAGLLLYTGEAVIPFGERLWAVPMSLLWAG